MEVPSQGCDLSMQNIFLNYTWVLVYFTRPYAHMGPSVATPLFCVLFDHG